MKKLWVLVIALLSIIAIAQSKTIGVGDSLPEFNLWNLNKESVSLSSLRGQAVILNFWASWCGPCRREMPELDRLHVLYGTKVKIIGVNVGELRGTFENVLTQTPVKYDIWYESRTATPKHSSTSNLISELQGTPGKGYFIPFTLMLKPDGTVYQVIEGFDPASKVLELATQALIELKL